MAAVERAGVATAARLRRNGARAFERPARTFSAASGRRQHPDRLSHDTRAILSRAAPASTAPVAKATGRPHAEEPAAAPAVGVDAGRVEQRALPPRRRRQRASTRDPLHREDLL